MDPVTAYGDSKRTLTFDGEAVTITGRSTLHGRYEKRVRLADIAAVQFKPAKSMTRGYIRIQQPGGARQFDWKRGDGVHLVDEDKDVVAFDRKQQPRFEHVRALIEQAQSAASTPAPTGLAGRLAEIERLYADGVITHEEWSTIRERLLGTYAAQ